MQSSEVDSFWNVAERLRELFVDANGITIEEGFESLVSDDQSESSDVEPQQTISMEEFIEMLLPLMAGQVDSESIHKFANRIDAYSDGKVHREIFVFVLDHAFNQPDGSNVAASVAQALLQSDARTDIQAVYEAILDEFMPHGSVRGVSKDMLMKFMSDTFADWLPPAMYEKLFLYLADGHPDGQAAILQEDRFVSGLVAALCFVMGEGQSADDPSTQTQPQAYSDHPVPSQQPQNPVTYPAKETQNAAAPESSGPLVGALSSRTVLSEVVTTPRASADVDECKSWLVAMIIRSEISLEEAFSEFCEGNFGGELNWQQFHSTAALMLQGRLTSGAIRVLWDSLLPHPQASGIDLGRWVACLNPILGMAQKLSQELDEQIAAMTAATDTGRSLQSDVQGSEGLPLPSPQLPSNQGTAVQQKTPVFSSKAASPFSTRNTRNAEEVEGTLVNKLLELFLTSNEAWDLLSQGRSSFTMITLTDSLETLFGPSEFTSLEIDLLFRLLDREGKAQVDRKQFQERLGSRLLDHQQAVSLPFPGDEMPAWAARGIFLIKRTLDQNECDADGAFLQIMGSEDESESPSYADAPFLMPLDQWNSEMDALLGAYMQKNEIAALWNYMFGDVQQIARPVWGRVLGGAIRLISSYPSVSATWTDAQKHAAFAFLNFIQNSGTSVWESAQLAAGEHASVIKKTTFLSSLQQQFSTILTPHDAENLWNAVVSGEADFAQVSILRWCCMLEDAFQCWTTSKLPAVAEESASQAMSASQSQSSPSLAPASSILRHASSRLNVRSASDCLAKLVHCLVENGCSASDSWQIAADGQETIPIFQFSDSIVDICGPEEFSSSEIDSLRRHVDSAGTGSISAESWSTSVGVAVSEAVQGWEFNYKELPSTAARTVNLIMATMNSNGLDQEQLFDSISVGGSEGSQPKLSKAIFLQAMFDALSDLVSQADLQTVWQSLFGPVATSTIKKVWLSRLSEVIHSIDLPAWSVVSEDARSLFEKFARAHFRDPTATSASVFDHVCGVQTQGASSMTKSSFLEGFSAYGQDPMALWSVLSGGDESIIALRWCAFCLLASDQLTASTVVSEVPPSQAVVPSAPVAMDDAAADSGSNKIDLARSTEEASRSTEKEDTPRSIPASDTSGYQRVSNAVQGSMGPILANVASAVEQINQDGEEQATESRSGTVEDPGPPLTQSDEPQNQTNPVDSSFNVHEDVQPSDSISQVHTSIADERKVNNAGLSNQETQEPSRPIDLKSSREDQAQAETEGGALQDTNGEASIVESAQQETKDETTTCVSENDPQSPRNSKSSEPAVPPVPTASAANVQLPSVPCTPTAATSSVPAPVPTSPVGGVQGSLAQGQGLPPRAPPTLPLSNSGSSMKNQPALPKDYYGASTTAQSTAALPAFYTPYSHEQSQPKQPPIIQSTNADMYEAHQPAQEIGHSHSHQVLPAGRVATGMQGTQSGSIGSFSPQHPVSAASNISDNDAATLIKQVLQLSASLDEARTESLRLQQELSKEKQQSKKIKAVAGKMLMERDKKRAQLEEEIRKLRSIIGNK